MPAKGREKVDLEQLAALCRLKPTLVDCAAFFKVNPSTIEKQIKRHTKLTFSEFREQNMVVTRNALIRKALDMAKNGHPAMLIFCLKNLCGWTDKHEVQSNPDKPFTLAYKIEK